MKSRKGLGFVSLDWIQWDWMAAPKSVDRLSHIFPYLHDKSCLKRIHSTAYCFGFLGFCFLYFSNLNINFILDVSVTNPSYGNQSLTWLVKKFAYIIFDLTVEYISIYFIQKHFAYIKWWQNTFIAKIYPKFLPSTC